MIRYFSIALLSAACALSFSPVASANGGEGAYASVTFQPEESTHLVVKNLRDEWQVETQVTRLVFHVHGSTGKKRRFKSWKTIVGPKGGNEQSFLQRRRSFSHGRTNQPSDYNGDGVIDIWKSLGDQTRGSKNAEKRHITFEGPPLRFFYLNSVEKVCEDAFLASIPANKRNDEAFKDANRAKFSDTVMVGIQAHTEMVVTAPPATKGLFRRDSTYDKPSQYNSGGVPQNFKIVCKSADPAAPATQTMTFAMPSSKLDVLEARWRTVGAQNQIVVRLKNNGARASDATLVKYRIVEDGKMYGAEKPVPSLAKGKGTTITFNLKSAKDGAAHSKTVADGAAVTIMEPYQKIDLLKSPVLPAG